MLYVVHALFVFDIRGVSCWTFFKQILNISFLWRLKTQFQTNKHTHTHTNLFELRNNSRCIYLGTFQTRVTFFSYFIRLNIRSKRVGSKAYLNSLKTCWEIIIFACRLTLSDVLQWKQDNRGSFYKNSACTCWQEKTLRWYIVVCVWPGATTILGRFPCTTFISFI